MPKEYFKLENTSSLKMLKIGARIHLIGVAGVAMAQLAVALSKSGYSVTGSDKDFYEPMGSLLKNNRITTFSGYNKENIQPDTELVVIGNAISYGNPEVELVEQKNIAYTCFPKLLSELIISDKHSVVATGTHGKSTTSAMLAFTFSKLELNPSYFIGGICNDFELSLFTGTGKYSVVEGDEYDSAFFAKVPKFYFYKPKTCIINAIEFDHADIYPNLEAINKEFTRMVNSVPADGEVICCIDYANIESLLSKWRKSSSCKFITFGEKEGADYRISSSTQHGMTQTVLVKPKDNQEFTFELDMPGIFNAKNALATLIVAKTLKLDFDAAKSALKSFKGLKRRQQIRFNNEAYLLIEDFAHHPTAVEATIGAIKASFPDKKLIAVFEPRSNTSRRKIFQDQYIEAFKKANQVILSNIQTRAIDQDQDLLDVQKLSASINTKTASICLENAKQIEEYIIKNLEANSVILIMSNGSFGGLAQNLEDKLVSIEKQS